MLLNICLALCTLNCSAACLYLKGWSPVSLKCHPSVLISLRVLAFSPPCFLLKPWASNCFSLNKCIFVCVLSPLVGTQLTCFLTPWHLYCQFSPVSCTSLDHGAQIVQPLGLGLVDTVLQSTCAEFQDVGSNIWFDLLEAMSCLLCETYVLMKQHE